MRAIGTPNRAAVEQTLAVAREGRRLIDEAEHLRLLVEPDLTVLIFERVGWTAEDYTRWSTRLLREDKGFVTPSRHRGEVRTRFAVVNPMTTVADLADLIESMRWIAERELAGRLELGLVMERTVEESRATNSPIKQIWVWTDIVSTGLLAFGQQFELQAYDP